ncbi:hypothetical protein PVAP13_6NG170900 [Panicum virgatum]|uniref:Nucleotide-diphospho-sugar transferase domain-containing protein n=1 Tax=Panicum virgatum TaxID=38727 RepID=A0A8T0QYQ3_PANVG|nr:hypothetical protein PVAP13_6NG170900 [Panicum virgatum]
MMWWRNRLQQCVLELGYSFLFMDMDILWFHSLFPRLPAGAKVVMLSDFFVGDPDSPNNYPNGRLLYVRSSPATVAFYEHWQASCARFLGKHEQYVFDMIFKEGVAMTIGTAMRFLDTVVFGGVACTASKDLGRVATMHTNYCVGQENKLFGGGTAGVDARGFSWRVPGRRQAHRRAKDRG